MRAEAPIYIPVALRHLDHEAHIEPPLQNDMQNETISLLDLDYGVIRDICSRLTCMEDVLSCMMTCRILRHELASCPISLDLHPHAHLSNSQAVSMIMSVIRYTPLLTSLDASNLTLESRDIDHFLINLPNLKSVSLSGCKQLNKNSLLFSDETPLCPSSLRELDLQRCFQLTAGCLKALITRHTQWNLHSLALSHLFFLPKGSEFSPSPTIKCLALNNCTQMDLEGLLFITSCCPNLSHLFLGGSTFVSDPISPKTQDPLLPIPRVDPSTPQLHSHPIVRVLQSLTLSLRHLEILELTFTGSDIIQRLKQSIDSRVQILDLSTTSGVDLAARCLKRDVTGIGLPAMIRCASKCKSSRKAVTPLHLAAHTGEERMVNGLLDLGALIDARDGTGATSLFVACEHGSYNVVKCLMDKGADLLIINSYGESPLYISALKGHLACVELIIITSKWKEIRYSDGWGPLHAACVGWTESHDQHLSIARLLISSASSPDERYQMLSASNRYGQTPIHLAARKGAVLLDLFFDPGAWEGSYGEGLLIKLATQKDANQCRPLDVALQNNHLGAIEILQRVIKLRQLHR